jgi:cellulose synthase/poly-beta-1,6-N-acetylglucosamine synthase-like glycosyltransferase
MNDPLGWILLTLCTAWGAQAVLAVLAQYKLADRAAAPQTQRYEFYRPPAVLIVPFKGVEPALRDNLHGLFTQDYADYRLLLIVDSESDPAYPLLREAIEQHPQRKAEVIIAGAAGPNEGQKVHNLIAAVEKLQRDSAGEVIWVFADSDAVPGPGWLGELVGPLAQDRTAVTTGFRWLIPRPIPGQDEATVWAKVASILNSSTTGFIRRERYTHAWGGSMAMRVATAQEGDLLGRWRGAISDDYQVTRMCKGIGRRVYFVPECLVASPVDYDFKALSNFAYRQYLITRIHAPLVYVAALAINALYFLGFAAAVMLLIRQRSLNHTLYAIAVFALVFLANQVRASYRRRVVQLTLGPDAVAQLRSTFTLERWATPFWLGVNLFLLARAAVGRAITWRGIRYRIDGPQKIQRL